MSEGLGGWVVPGRAVLEYEVQDCQRVAPKGATVPLKGATSNRANGLPGGLIETYHGTLWVAGFVVQVQHILHPGHELPAHLGDAPLFLLPWFEFVFLSIWRTVSREMLPANSIATTWLASSWSVQFVCPSGALLHAMATRCASCLPLSLRSRPDRGRSLIAASSPSSTNRLRTLATVAALSETASLPRGLRVLRQLSTAQGPALPCGPTACHGRMFQSERSVRIGSVRLCIWRQACQVRPR